MAENSGISNGVDKINILGINISAGRRAEIRGKINEFLADGKQHQIITPNPEIILKAVSHDEELFYILNRADLAVPDGVGLKIASWFMGKNLPRTAGADLLKDILYLAQKKNLRVAVLNWRGGLSAADSIKQALAEKYSELQAIVVDIERQTAAPDGVLARIREFKPEIIFSTLGAPYQEKFIFHGLPDLPSVKIGMGVGGAFDFLTGRIKRAPGAMRRLGLEWLWRLIKQPRRFSRIYNAVVVFPVKFFRWRFILPFRYRPNVVGLLYKREQDKYNILIVERADQKGHWQLPQGGTDGEKVITAGTRELSEELNTNKFKPVAAFDKLHQYEFGNMMSKFLVPAKTARGYKGQKQGLFIAEFTGADSDIKVNFYEHSAWRWVSAEKLVEAVYQTRRPAAEKFMEKFWQTVKK